MLRAHSKSSYSSYFKERESSLSHFKCSLLIAAQWLHAPTERALTSSFLSSSARVKPMDNSNSNNWLGFSLSPQLNMELSSDSHHHHHHHQQQHHHHQQQQSQQQPSPSSSSSVPSSSMFLSPPAHLCCYDQQAAAAGLYSQLSSMPIKSDGSLCIMEALSRSSSSHHQGMVPCPSPKLEDFLGGGGGGAGGVPTPTPSMGAHHHDSEATITTTTTNNTMYYNQGVEVHAQQKPPLELFQQPFYFQPLQESSMLLSAGLYHHHHHHHAGLEEEEAMGADEDGFPSLKNWASVGYGDLHTLSLSMSPGSQSSCVTAPQHHHHHSSNSMHTAPHAVGVAAASHGDAAPLPAATATDCMALDVVVAKKRGAGKGGQKQPVHRKSIDTFGQRTSQYRGVTRHRWTGRYEAHLWDNSCKKEGQTRKGRQVYLGGYDMEEKAARAYDLAALKYWGPSTHINFPLENYHGELEEMKNMSRQEYVAHLRRKSSGFSRGASMYRGVTRHHQHGRWQARIGRVAGNKDLYLGTFSTQEEAAEAYDIAAIKFRGASAVTNFDITRYDVEKIMASNTLLSGEDARRLKSIEAGICTIDALTDPNTNGGEINLTEDNNSVGSDWKMVLYDSPSQTPQTSGTIDHNQQPVSVAFHGLIGMETVNYAQGIEESGKIVAGSHISNPSSLVTSLNSSREGSPDRAGLSMVYAKPEHKLINISASPIGSWIPSTQLRPAAISMAHVPLFAAWSDA